MILETKRILKLLVLDDEIFPLKAKIYKKFLEALVLEGFTREEAMQILINTGEAK